MHYTSVWWPNFRCFLGCFQVTINICVDMRTQWLQSSMVCIVSNQLAAKRCLWFLAMLIACNCSHSDCEFNLMWFLLFDWKQTRFIVMGNLFCSEYRIHRRFDLKGSSYGRTTDKPDGVIDETTTLKDLDLNFVFRLQRALFQELIMLVLISLNFFVSSPKLCWVIFCFYNQVILCLDS